ncbi:MAG: hypothetical protein EZS28_036044 [Streblomastix strix]|uniref:Tyr recombinase domain-containing protein n=1 Tax=Streblomastix strix TaxID=222440 RepID=A0A5J4UCW3_9EUKA|nr:MAG: hypothetical protein EZS28_036044 [Streblomastix strix]
MGGSPRLSLNIMATRGTISTPAYSSDTANSKQINGREGTSSDDPTILAVSTVMACTHEDDIKIDYLRRKRRRLSPWRQDEEVKEAPTTRKNDGCLIRGDRGEELFRWVLSKRGLTRTAIQNDINGWHEAWRRHRQRSGEFDEYQISQGKRRADILNIEDPELVIASFISQLEVEDVTNANQANCRSALSAQFQLQGFKKEKINGVVLQQIMKKPQARMRKPIKEKQVWNYDQLLKYIKSKSDQKTQQSEIEFLGIVIGTIMGYSTLRLIEVHRFMVLKLPKGCWQVKAAMFKGHDTGVTVIFRPLEDLSICSIEWLSSWMNRRKKKDEKTSCLVVILQEQGATKTEINRALRHRKGSQAVANHNYKNLNDMIGTRLAKF